MAKVGLFKTKESLWDGYCDINRPYRLDNNLKKGKGGRKVYLLGRQLATGNISLYRYACNNGKRQREFLNVILKIEVDYNVKRENEEKLRLQVEACNLLNNDLTRRDADFTASLKSKVRLVDFIRKVGEDALRQTGNRHSTYAAMESVAKHVETFAGKDVRFKDVDEDWCRSFIYYLKHDALNMNFTRTDKEGRRKEIKISQNTQHRIIVKLNQVLRLATKGKNKLLASNPMDALDAKDKVSSKKGTREYLDEEEVKRLMATPFTHGAYNIKEAFIFSCFTGLRFSDLKQLRMSDFRIDKN